MCGQISQVVQKEISGYQYNQFDLRPILAICVQI